MAVLLYVIYTSNALVWMTCVVLQEAGVGCYVALSRFQSSVSPLLRVEVALSVGM